MPGAWLKELSDNAYDDFFSRVRKKQGASLLDLSAGYDLVPFVAGKGFKVSSIDAAKEILEPAKNRRKFSLGGLDAAFDGILCLGTFSYLPREAAPALVLEIERLLAPAALVFTSFAPVWSNTTDDSKSVRTFFDREGFAYRRDHGNFGTFVLYQTREIENLFRRMKIVSLVTQANGARRLIAMKKAAT